MNLLTKSILVVTVFLSINGCRESNNTLQTTNTAKIATCFTPGGNCTEQIVNIINQAQKDILVQAYSFSSAPIAQALVAAKKRNVDVTVILDKSQAKQHYSSSQFLANYNIPVFIDYKPAIAHNKIMIVDSRIVITGSFNFTKAAQEKNTENLLIIRDAKTAETYNKNWHERLIKSMTLTDYVKSHIQYANRKTKDLF